MATISATDQDKLRDGFAPLLEGFKVVEFDNLEAALGAIDGNTAGFLLEPVQGEGGIRPASKAFIAGLRNACDDNDLMLVFDEVQCGVARTGTLYAYEQYGVAPDILASAKGIGGGFPMGACLATEQAASGMVIGTHGSTYGGNPLAMAAGQAVFEARCTRCHGTYDEGRLRGGWSRIPTYSRRRTAWGPIPRAGWRSVSRWLSSGHDLDGGFGVVGAGAEALADVHPVDAGSGARPRL